MKTEVIIAEKTTNSLALLNNFLSEWNRVYQDSLVRIPLFMPNAAANWNEKQKSCFIRIFYHVRGHFHKFLWHFGNYAPNSRCKEAIIDNISEEFGGNGKSHEQLYIDFAKNLDVDIMTEIIDEEYYLPFVKEFNTAHINWLLNHSWYNRYAAFSAYERLDNIDYSFLYKLVKKFKKDKMELNFFVEHMNADHFDKTFDYLSEIWNADSKMVREAFDFIFHTQIKMWRSFSDEILKTNEFMDKITNA